MQLRHPVVGQGSPRVPGSPRQAGRGTPPQRKAEPLPHSCAHQASLRGKELELENAELRSRLANNTYGSYVPALAAQAWTAGSYVPAPLAHR